MSPLPYRVLLVTVVITLHIVSPLSYRVLIGYSAHNPSAQQRHTELEIGAFETFERSNQSDI